MECTDLRWMVIRRSRQQPIFHLLDRRVIVSNRVEHAIADHEMEVQMRIERGAEAVYEGDRAESSRGARTWAVRTQT